MSLEPQHFSLYGFPLDDPEREQAMRLREATVAAGPLLLRKMAEFFLYVADLQEQHGSAFGHEHFCDFAKVPAPLQRAADVIITAPSTDR